MICWLRRSIFGQAVGGFHCWIQDRQSEGVATSIDIAVGDPNAFVFDPERQAIMLVAGDKSGRWSRWYQDNIQIAEDRYDKWLEGGYDEVIQ